MTYTKSKVKYKISIIGDSISTYIGFNPYDYPVYYKDDRAYDNEIESVDDTWWKQVIDNVGGELCVNNSYSGSLVAGNYESSACSAERCSMLHTSDVTPDIILIYIGTNDRGFEVNVGIESPNDTQNFYGAYRAMLRQLKTNYPAAKIICATLLMGKLKDTVDLAYDRFMREDNRYNEFSVYDTVTTHVPACAELTPPWKRARSILLRSNVLTRASREQNVFMRFPTI